MKNAFPALLLLTFLSCSSPAEKLMGLSAYEQQTVIAQCDREVIIAALRQKESDASLQYLKVDNSRIVPIQEVAQRATLFQSAVMRTVGYKLEGTIENSAMIANFKDIEIEIAYVAGNGSDISSETIKIFETVRAGDSNEFSIKVNRPDQTESFRYTLRSAVGTK